MESAPQSTIAHNAVIELASRSWCTPRLSPRARRAHKKKACPAQKGGLKSAGPCPKNTPRATPPEGPNPAFRQDFPPGPGLFRKNYKKAFERRGRGDSPPPPPQ